MSPKPILYSLDMSPPVRFVHFTAEFIGLELEIRNVDIFNRQHVSDEFLKMNPQHTIPTLNDNGVVVWESAAICTYLIGKYANGECSLYPTDLVERAHIDQRLYFNAAVLFPLLRKGTVDVLFNKDSELSLELLADIQSAYDHLERFLQDGPYLVGDHLTLADFAVVCTLTNLVEWAPLAVGRYPLIEAWLPRVAHCIPEYEARNMVPVRAYGQLVATRLAENRKAAN